jgi:hypothetical protein
MISGVTEEVAEKMQSRCEWCILLKSQGTNGGGDDRFAHRSEEKLLMIIYKRINE